MIQYGYNSHHNSSRYARKNLVCLYQISARQSEKGNFDQNIIFELNKSKESRESKLQNTFKVSFETRVICSGSRGNVYIVNLVHVADAFLTAYIY